jgi:drug/metabolite transporter (DMT)-like permease
MQWRSQERLAFVALLGGASGIGFAPIFVRLSEVGPSATAFYRILFALPVLWLADRLGKPAEVSEHQLVSARWICGLAGVLFAGDLAFWHWSIRLTSVANSTLLTNCAPFFVMWGARLLFRERITGALVAGMVIAAVGAAVLVGANLKLTGTHFKGDLLALVTAVFYGGYLLTVKYLRTTLSSTQILFWSGLVSSTLLLLIAILSHETIRASTSHGWIILVALAVISHVGGQGLIGYALAHLPAGFSSVSLLTQPVVAAVLAWLILSEPLGWLQSLGGAGVLLGIAVAGAGKTHPRPLANSRT